MMNGRRKKIGNCHVVELIGLESEHKQQDATNVCTVFQNDVQRRGRCCRKKPTSCIVGDVFEEFGWRRVLDVTYGVGGFYLCFRDVLDVLIGVDPIKHDWIVEPDVFFQMPIQDVVKYADVLYGEVDVIVVDPPWRHGGIRTNRKHRYLTTTVGFRLDIVKTAVELAKKLAVPLLAHYSPKDRHITREFEKLSVVRKIAYRSRDRRFKSESVTYFAVLF